jgi:hypothetical protein
MIIVANFSDELAKIELPFAIESLLQVGDATLSGPQAALGPHSAVVGVRA